jgi:hypothetical protein
MAFSTVLRRFQITTGSANPVTKVIGAAFPDGRCIIREYLASGIYSTEQESSLTDVLARYSAHEGYVLAYIDATTPTYTSVSPTSGAAAGGTTIVITGTNLNSASVAVTVGGVAATTVRSNATTISCVTGAHAAGAVDIVITTNEGTVTGTSAFTYT